MEKYIFTLFLAISFNVCFTTTEKETVNLQIFYPDFSRIDLVCETMPKPQDTDVVFCCEAAFTGQLLDSFSHSNIVGRHISSGKMYNKSSAGCGGFVWGQGGWQFLSKSAFPTLSGKFTAGFCQWFLLFNGHRQSDAIMIMKRKEIYRALCEKEGRLCLIQSKKVVTLDFFIKCLEAYKVDNALYLDMGAGWNYAWYRDNKGIVKELFPKSKQSSNFKYRTNWITFYK